ncbi:MAG: hypothetical protein ACJA0Z_004041 [Halioglobus sp.]
MIAPVNVAISAFMSKQGITSEMRRILNGYSLTLFEGQIEELISHVHGVVTQFRVNAMPDKVEKPWPMTGISQYLNELASFDTVRVA